MLDLVTSLYDKITRLISYSSSAVKIGFIEYLSYVETSFKVVTKLSLIESVFKVCILIFRVCKNSLGILPE